ncbi:hypothetical protein BJX68DRAFT_235104 [Aspergillus pseudodeflectus]|uniref:Uncharacterized protein n=1 Tax=Aspergillus pseudodeflectus TaxID=176178 RepID=A0ABR4KIY0_9EURO
MGGGSPLLSPNALKVVSNYPTQIVAVIKEDADDDEADPEFAAVPDEDQPRPETSPAACAPHASVQPPTISAGHSKQILLHALLQPALQWYSTTQTYCRRISAQDKHHRQRFTPEAEYQVILAYRELESELWRLWSERPKIMLLATDELTKTVSPDVATRLHEVFSVHLASFWILFVYLHRVCWWNLPHSATVKRALEEVWLHLQGAYGELPAGGDKKRIVHPTLMWPVFLFGLECTQPDRREWAIDQLVALGQAKPALKLGEDEDDETLPPFRISSGATRNATRAAALLKEVVKQQDTSAARVDDRDLSMKIFGCYFCLI